MTPTYKQQVQSFVPETGKMDPDNIHNGAAIGVDEIALVHASLVSSDLTHTQQHQQQQQQRDLSPLYFCGSYNRKIVYWILVGITIGCLMTAGVLIGTVCGRGSCLLSSKSSSSTPAATGSRETHDNPTSWPTLSNAPSNSGTTYKQVDDPTPQIPIVPATIAPTALQAPASPKSESDDTSNNETQAPAIDEEASTRVPTTVPTYHNPPTLRPSAIVRPSVVVSPTTPPPQTLGEPTMMTTTIVPSTTMSSDNNNNNAPPDARNIENVAMMIQQHSWLNVPLRYGSAPADSLNDPSPEEQALAWILHEDPWSGGTVMMDDDDLLLERYALLTVWFQQSQSKSMSGWATSAPVCDWEHIGCDEEGGRSSVTELNMESIQLVGTMSPELALLTNLRLMNLEDNPLLTGTIPFSIGKALTKLTFLDLGPNGLSGTLPSTLGLLTALTFFSVNRCPGIQGTIPEELGQWTHLERAGFFGTNLTGPMPLCDGGIESLYSLTVDCDQVECMCCTFCCPGERDGIPAFVKESCV